MSETFFAVNDLLRRKFQTGLAVLCLTLCTASTLFIFLLGNRTGVGILSVIEGKLAGAFHVVFSQFIAFIGLVNLAVAVLIASFVANLMMSQRSRDIGLIRAAGCPNDIVFSYFMNQLILITLMGCFLGVIAGFLADFAFASVFIPFGVKTSGLADLWLELLVFALFFALSMIFGAKPIYDITKVKPVGAVSLSCAYGVHREGKFRATRKSFLALHIALRSLLRRKSATFRLALCLVAVFILVTVSVAGAIVADETTKNWVQGVVGKDIVLVAHQDICTQYMVLLDISETRPSTGFNYTDERYLIPQELLDNLTSTPGMDFVDRRLIMACHVKEVPGVVYGQTTGQTETVGDKREGDALIIGLEPSQTLTSWFFYGAFLENSIEREVVIGDSLSREMFTEPLIQKAFCVNDTFRILGVCVDLTNNGRSMYVPLAVLQNDTGIQLPNVALIRVTPINLESLQKLRASVAAFDPRFEVRELNWLLDRNLNSIGYVWNSIMLLPFSALTMASLCLTSYMALVMDEQKHELGLLKAVGAEPSAITGIIAWQSLVVLFSAFGAGVAIGTMLTLLILIPEPLVTGLTVARIAAMLFAGLAVVFGLSLIPALRFSRKPVLEAVTQH